MDFLASSSISVQVQERFRAKLRPNLKIGEQYHLSITGNAILVGTCSGGGLELAVDFCEVAMSRKRERRSLSANNTLRGIERMIWFSLYGNDPTDKELDEIHEDLLAEYAPKVASKLTDAMIPMRSSAMDSKQMSVFIDDCLAHLATMDVPETVYAAMGRSIRALYHEWYEWRYSNGEDVIKDLVPRTWPKYKMRYPYCEFCFTGPTANDPLERMHIVSVGDEKQFENEPWNWIHSHSSHHQGVMHQKGWSALLAQFPHMRNKVAAAYKLAGKDFTW